MKKRQIHKKRLLFRKSLALFLAGLVLMSSSGVTVFKQTCLMMGTQTVALFHPHEPDCCDKPEKKDKSMSADDCTHMSIPQEHKVVKPTACCDISVDLIKADIQNSVSKSTDNSFKSPFIFITNTPYSFENIVCNKNLHLKYFFADSSPPLSGRTLIIRKQSFLL